MKTLLLRGLSGSSPLSVMASYGLLRLCQEIPDLTSTKLSWRQKTENGAYLDDPTAELTLPDQVGRAELIHILSEHVQKKDIDYFSWDKDVRINPNIYREMIVSHIIPSGRYNREWVDTLASLGSEVVKDKSKGLVKPSPFYMTSGQQKFLETISKIAGSMKNGTKEALDEALFGPWTYSDPFHSLGWDPSAERIHALREKSPTSEQARCVRAAVYLATESLPLFPTVALPNGKITAVGFSRSENGTQGFVWPLWEPPIGIDSLKSLLNLPELHDARKDKASLARRGLFAVYRSERWEFAKGYGIFRPASVVWSK